jgi:ABC-2 type transport system permease protein
LFVPGLVGIGIAGTAFFTIGVTMATYRERHILRRLRVTPLHPLVIIFSHLVSGFALILINALILTVLGNILYGAQMLGSLGTVLLAVLLGTISFFAMGILLVSLLPSVRAINAAAMALFMGMISLSGAFFPLKFMPNDVVRSVGQALPLTYVVNVLQAAWLDNNLGQPIDLIVLAVAALGGWALSAVFFKWE